MPKQHQFITNSVFQSLLNLLMILGPGVDEADLFLDQRGPLSKWKFHAIAKKYAYQARLEDSTAHTVRHSLAKNPVDARTPLDQVAALLSHESLDTAHIYTQPSARDLLQAVQRAARDIVDE